ncbi:MAG: phenylalanine--tRNA ligase subunit beta [Candidatus Poribacteria bacterium]|nr:phenylalanine--tRNA ligase subunit beta [Candidatus Poribacteria bacterium]
MRISVNWLKQYVDFDLTPKDIADKLTMLGQEVEEIAPLNPGIEDVVVARIDEIKPHPDADRLRVCSVNTGSGFQQVVCGAPNAREGLVAPLALVGARLPNGMTIKPTKLRGVESLGMLCSARELGLSEDAEGLLELSPTLKLGAPLVEAMGLNDTAMELSITPNRPDCLSIIGIARELATLLNVELRVPSPTIHEGETPIESVTSIKIDAAPLCPRYAARVIKGVTIKPSPSWLQNRLVSVGLRPINNVVDVTNFVLMELGHPLHAFDYDLLGENRIVVRRAESGESMETLDGSTRSLTSETLVIADAARSVALAGVMGGGNSEVSETTTNILIESAYFNPISIRRTSKAMGLQTEASYRFERGADPNGVLLALERTTQLIAEVAGGEVCKGIIDVYPEPIQPLNLTLRTDRTNDLLGTNVTAERMASILTGLGFGVEQDEPLRVTVPTFRPDIEREIDLVEEIARVYGFDNMPTTMPRGEFPVPQIDASVGMRRRIENVMRECGLFEACNYAWYGPTALDKIRIPEGDELRDHLVVANPFSSEQSLMRRSLLPSLIENVRYNRHHQVERVALYELQRVFIPTNDDLPDERWVLAGVLCGATPKHWSSAERAPDFYDVKGIVERLFEELRITDYQVERGDHPTFHPGRCAIATRDGSALATFGEVHPDARANFDIADRVYLFEVPVGGLESLVNATQWMEPLPPFPSSMRDIAVVVDESVAAGDVKRVIESATDDLLGSVYLFDVYLGDRIAHGKKSLAFALEYRSFERTLTDTEVDQKQQHILAALTERFGAELRS